MEQGKLKWLFIGTVELRPHGPVTVDSTVNKKERLERQGIEISEAGNVHIITNETYSFIR